MTTTQTRVGNNRQMVKIILRFKYRSKTITIEGRGCWKRRALDDVGASNCLYAVAYREQNLVPRNDGKGSGIMGPIRSREENH